MATELRIPLRTRYADPRIGETVYQVTKLTRGEPDAALFTIPGDYRIVDRAPEQPQLR